MISGKNAYRTHKFMFYTTGLLGALPSRRLFRRWLKKRFEAFDKLPRHEQETIMARVNYYNRLDAPAALSSTAVSNRDFAVLARKSTYNIDFYNVAKYFPAGAAYHYRFGDKSFVPDEPTFVKSRPIAGDNRNSVLLKLNSVRHFYRVKDPRRYADKQDALVWRGAAHQPHRMRFLQRCQSSRHCDIGATDNKASTAAFRKPFMSIERQLDYKFIFSIEGNDVATNLKWIMASNSLCFMQRPMYETWFMEGTLISGYHYVQVKDDFSNLDSQIEYYLAHPDEAQAIIRNANRYVAGFYNARQERLTALLVFDRYLAQTHPQSTT